MSSAFDIVPTPPEAENLDVALTPSAEGGGGSSRKWYCENGIYQAVCAGLKKESREGKPDRIVVDYILTDPAEKGLRVKGFYEISEQWGWKLERAMEAFGVYKNKETNVLPLRENYNKIVGGTCTLELKQRPVGDKVFMDIVKVTQPAATTGGGSEAAPF